MRGLPKHVLNCVVGNGIFVIVLFTDPNPCFENKSDPDLCLDNVSIHEKCINMFSKLYVLKDLAKMSNSIVFLKKYLNTNMNIYILEINQNTKKY